MDSQLQLSEDGIVKTVAALHNRISDRFPDSGLAGLCRQLLSVAEKSAVRSRGIGQSVWWIRICGYTLAVLIIALLAAMIWMLSHSPSEAMTPLQLSRYLDYCTEMLSLIGKIAALYVQRFDDSSAVAAVSEVEQLTTGLSRKIWQKIMLLNQIADAGEGSRVRPLSSVAAGRVAEIVSPGGGASEPSPGTPAKAPPDPESA
jgi:hypothetical protein